MALWGNKDAVGSEGTVTISYSDPNWIVIGSGTSFGNVGAASTGDVIRFGDRDGTYYGDAVIIGISSTTQITIGSTAGLSSVSFGATSFSVSQLPKYTILDSHYSEVNTQYDAHVYGVSEDEVQASKLTEYTATHAGWVGVTTYLDYEGNLRVKNEVLVAMSSIIEDANDDAVFPDFVIVIVQQPSSTGIGSTEIALFEVEAEVTPTTELSYQWQENSGTGFIDLDDDQEYDGVNTPLLEVFNDNDKDGYEYRVVISAGEDTTLVSDSATLTYV
jgi:hypothetical protein